MRIYTENGIRIIEADSGLYLFNGETYSEKVYLGKNADPSDWAETEWDGAYPQEPTAEDKAEAYDILIGEDGDGE